MLFLLQKEATSVQFDMDTLILKNLLDREKLVHTYISMSLNMLKEMYKNEKSIEDLKNAIPVGTIEFVQEWLSLFHGINTINPIEVPECLRTEEFLKRKYSIVDAENIPKKGEYFIKDASKLKVFYYAGELGYSFSEDIFKEQTAKFDTKLHLDKTHLFQVSEVIHILSEYRVYVINGKIQSIINYDGDPLILPDVKLIEKANVIYQYEKNAPKSYTIDIAVTNKGTCILEVHNFQSVGLYTQLFGTNLCHAYIDGIDYLLNSNKAPVKFSNFS